MRDGQRHAHVLLDQKDRDTRVVNALHDLEDELNHFRRKPQGRFIEQEQLRPSHEPTTHGEHLLFPA